MADETDTQQLMNKYYQMRTEYNTMMQKMGELDSERHEHQIVADAISALEPERKCFRLVGGVLVERTVGEVLPVVTQQRDQIADVIKQMNEQLAKKSEAMNDFQRKYNLNVKNEAAQVKAKGDKGQQNNLGVLA